LLRGWSSYFSYGTRLMAYRAAESCIDWLGWNFAKEDHGHCSNPSISTPQNNMGTAC